MSSPEGHRERLRQRFKENPLSLTEIEQLELILTYCILRKDVAPIAHNLIARFGSLQAVITAPVEQLSEIDGVGEATVTFFQLLQTMTAKIVEVSSDMQITKGNMDSSQLNLFKLDPPDEKSSVAAIQVKKKPAIQKHQMSVFVDDEVANSLTFLQHVGEFQTLDDFKKYLQEKLPYNAVDTRRRRASYIAERFYPEGNLATPLTYFVTHCSGEVNLKPVVFYHILNEEPMARKVADDFIWPALPVGHIDREQLREFIQRLLPDIKVATQAKILQALFHTYDLLNIGSVSGSTLRFQLHTGTLESFIYVFTSQFAQPGMYSFDTMFSGPIHHWLLWDREWIRKQIYNLLDFGVISKISEIDTLRQFTMSLDQNAALRQYFEYAEDKKPAIRESSEE